MIAGRRMSLASVAILAALGTGFASWSGFTSPEIAGVQLQIASENLAAASSFTSIIDETESVFGSSEVIIIHEMVHHRAPDRLSVVDTVHYTGAGVTHYSFTRTLTQIGDSCWTTIAGPTRPGNLKPLGCSASTLRHVSLSSAETQSVTEHNGTYYLSSTVAEKYLSQYVPYPIGMVKIEARIEGEYISWQRISFELAASNATIDVVETTKFSDYGTTPPIPTPPGPMTANA